MFLEGNFFFRQALFYGLGHHIVNLRSSKRQLCLFHLISRYVPVLVRATGDPRGNRTVCYLNQKSIALAHGVCVPHDLPRVLAGTNGVSPRQGSQGTQRIEFGGRNLQPLPAFLQGCSCLASCALQKVVDTLPPLTQQPVGLGQGGTLYE